MKTPTIQHLPTEDLRWHPLVQALPRWADDAPEMIALRGDIAARGVDQPIIVVEDEETGEHLVIDGRHRHRAASLAEIATIPVIVRPESDAVDIVLHTLCDRRHFTKGALAYMSYPVLKVGLHGKPGRPSTKLSTQSTISMEFALLQLGFSRDLYFQAKTLHEAFERRPDLKYRMEPSCNVSRSCWICASMPPASMDGSKSNASR